MFVIESWFTGLQKLVLAGRISDAIEATQSLYPGLLDRNLDLLFKLKCRQFIEMVTGCDGEVKPSAHSPTRSTLSSPGSSPGRTISHANIGTTSNLATNGFLHNDANQQKTLDAAGNEVTGNGVAAETENGVILDDDMEMDDVSNAGNSNMNLSNSQPGPSTSNHPNANQFYSSPVRGSQISFMIVTYGKVELMRDVLNVA